MRSLMSDAPNAFRLLKVFQRTRDAFFVQVLRASPKGIDEASIRRPFRRRNLSFLELRSGTNWRLPRR